MRYDIIKPELSSIEVKDIVIITFPADKRLDHHMRQDIAEYAQAVQRLTGKPVLVVTEGSSLVSLDKQSIMSIFGDKNGNSC